MNTKKAENLFDQPAGPKQKPRYVGGEELLKLKQFAAGAGEVDGLDPMTMHPSDLRAAVVLSPRKSYRHAFLQGILMERVSLETLRAQAETLPPDSPIRGLVDGLIHARTIRCAGTGGATEAARG